MATNQVKTRIVLRNDELANWEKSAKTLLSGEVALARTTNGKVEVRVGNGKTYSEALPLQISANQVVGLEGELASLSSTHYEVGSFDELTFKTDLNAGDTGVVKTQIADTGKYTYTAYVYDGEKWAAMDGNYDAENVYFTNDITLAGNYTTVGNVTKAQNGTGVLSAKGKSVKDVMMEIFTKKLQPTITAQLSVNLTFNEAKSYEVGTKVTPKYTASLNAGSYTYGPATGVTATGWSVTDGTATKTTSTGSFDELTVADSMNYKLTATATHTEGAVAKDNLGNDSDPVKKIAAGSKSKTSEAITGYRNSFYGTKTTKDGTVDSAYIRSLTKSNAAYSNGSKFTITIPVGAVRVVFAYPSTLQDVTSVNDVNGLGAQVKSTFTKSTVNVEGANGYTAKEYKVYMTDFANPVEKANTYNVTI